MENYEQKYKEALKRAKTILELTDNPEEANGYVFTIFPELCESEDERIRKGLIKGLSAMRDIHKHQTFSNDAINIDDAITWLEKQGEQKSWSEEDEKMWSQVINEIEAIKSNSSTIFEKNIAQDKINWLKSLKPNRWKPSDEQMEALNDVRHLNPGLVSLYWKLKKS